MKMPPSLCDSMICQLTALLDWLALTREQISKWEKVIDFPPVETLPRNTRRSP